MEKNIKKRAFYTMTGLAVLLSSGVAFAMEGGNNDKDKGVTVKKTASSTKSSHKVEIEVSHKVEIEVPSAEDVESQIQFKFGQWGASGPMGCDFGYDQVYYHPKATPIVTTHHKSKWFFTSENYQYGACYFTKWVRDYSPQPKEPPKPKLKFDKLFLSADKVCAAYKVTSSEPEGWGSVPEYHLCLEGLCLEGPKSKEESKKESKEGKSH